MAENRRVEARSIIGNGNATDPETIVELEDEWARRVRGNTAPPQRKFGTVAQEAAQKTAEKKSDSSEEPANPKTQKEHLPRTVESKLGVRLIRI